MAAMCEISARLYTAAQVRRLDRALIAERGDDGYELMCRAGAAVFEAARAAWPEARRWRVACGGGNNAGDGYVVARLAAAAGLEVTVVGLRAPGELDGAAARAARAWQDAGGEVQAAGQARPGAAELAIDALLGTGLDRAVEGAYAEAIDALNALACPRLAVDLPSGLNADTGEVMGRAVRADLTVSFIGQKRGLFTADGPDHAGRVIFDPLGAPASVHHAVDGAGRLDDAGWLARQLPRRPRNSHKGRFGHVLIVGGNAGMGGAARLAGEAALRAGAGLVSVATHPAHAPALNLARPELMVHGIKVTDDLQPLLERATVVALGPGLGQDEWARTTWTACLAAGRPLVIDADALNLLAEQPRPGGDWILTPHPAEAGRLLDCSAGAVQADRFAAAAELAERFRSVAVLKGCGTITARPGGAWALCAAGNPAMATAGSGDVLTGVVAALLAQGLEAWPAARAAVVAHAAAGDRAAGGSERGMLAGDITAALPEVLNGHRPD